MHPTCKVLAPIAVVVLLHSLLGAAPKDKAKDVRLTFEAKPVKERFAYREPIQFRFRLENVGATDVLVLKPLTLFLSVHLKITGPDGKPVLRCGPIPLVAREEEDFRVLRPGERLEEEARISCQGEEGPPEERWGYSIPGPGKYTCRTQVPGRDRGQLDSHERRQTNSFLPRGRCSFPG